MWAWVSQGTHWGDGLAETGVPREVPNITMVLALEPSVGTVESASLTPAPLLPLLSAPQAAGVRFVDRQALGGGVW